MEFGMESGRKIFTLKKTRKSIPITGHGGPKRYDMSMIPHFPHNRLTNGGEFVSLMHQSSFTPQKHS